MRNPVRARAFGGLVLGLAGLLSAGCAAGASRLASGSASDRPDAPPMSARADYVVVSVAPPAPDFSRPASPCALPSAPCAAPCAPYCGLPCESGETLWHVRALGGFSTWSGDDPGSDCAYYGADVGRTFCGCFGLDAFYRGHTSRFDSDEGEDGGQFHHIGIKATYERSFGGSRLFGFVGAGPEYFWTSDYLDDDSGFGVYGEAGVGYAISRRFRVRAGVAVHGLDTDVTRRFPADDGQSRWLWVIAPNVGVELDF